MTKLANFSLCALAVLLPVTSSAQDEAFLRCANFSEREARVQCLETELNQAVSEQNSKQTTATPSAPSTTQAPTVKAESTATPQAAGAVEPTSKSFELFGLLNRDKAPKPTKDIEAMQAEITELKLYKTDAWTITLDNGQVWRQLYTKRYALRVSDAIKIYKSEWGEQFRLEAERFNGFIQVERLR
jgi:hypothetical protein